MKRVIRLKESQLVDLIERMVVETKKAEKKVVAEAAKKNSGKKPAPKPAPKKKK